MKLDLQVLLDLQAPVENLGQHQLEESVVSRDQQDQPVLPDPPDLQDHQDNEVNLEHVVDEEKVVHPDLVAKSDQVDQLDLPVHPDRLDHQDSGENLESKDNPDLQDQQVCIPSTL